MLQLLNYSKTIQKHIKYFKDKSFISKNTIAYLHKYMIHINRVFKVYYLQYIVNLCCIIIPSAYEWVSKECKCSRNQGAGGRASSYLSGNTGAGITYI